MTETTKTRTEAPLAALIFGVVALVFAVPAMGPGIPVIAGTIAVIAACVDITRTAGGRPNWMTITGLIAALVGVFAGFTFLGA